MQSQPLFPTQPSDTSFDDLDQFPFLSVPEHSSQLVSYTGEQAETQGLSRSWRRFGTI